MDKSPKRAPKPKQPKKIITEKNKDDILEKELTTGKLGKNKFANNKVKKGAPKMF